MNKKCLWNEQKYRWLKRLLAVGWSAFLFFGVCFGFKTQAFSETKTGETSSQQTFDFQLKSGEKCSLNCFQKNIYNYFFNYLQERDGIWGDLDSNAVNKCDRIKFNFSPGAENFTALKGDCSNGTGNSVAEKQNLIAPFYLNTFLPFFLTQKADCSSQIDCLKRAEEHSLGQEKWSKGVQKIPADLLTSTEESLGSSSPYVNCSLGVCSILGSGNFSFFAKAPASSFFGQCRGYGATIDLPEAVAPQVESQIDLTVKNRPPAVSVSFAKNSIQPNEGTEVFCDVVDPDSCSDKIKEIEWNCVDSEGNSDNCFLQIDNNSVLLKGSVAREILSSEQTNPYRAKAVFKANSAGSFMVTCKAKDDDPNNPLSGLGIGGIKVLTDQNTGNEGKSTETKKDPNQTENNSPQSSSYCAVLAEESEVCGNQGEIKYKAFYGDNVEPKTFKWSCGESFPITDSPNSTTNCPYNRAGSYLPSLQIIDKNNQKIDCVSQVSGEVIGDQGDCFVEVRPKNSLDNFKSNLTVGRGVKTEVRITRRCFEGGQVEWQSNTGFLIGVDDSKAEWQSSEETETAIGASVKKDGQQINCREAEIKVKNNLPANNQDSSVFIR